MKYIVNIRYIDMESIYPIQYECDGWHVENGELRLNNHSSAMFIQLRHVRSYDIVEVEDKKE